ncbi:hypothetical protein EB796_019147 [Bugula neritina]|uniref:Uncharacterized protein n=1 Tax=Bugula neritina TaxID=10212 RepID=A0A7J7JA90_BUGNE|nr:hypothetical protein EB796_019147 [Bugula neritina]
MLKHHEEIRERRKRIRAGIHVEALSSDKFTENNNYIIAEAAKKQIPGLWVSRDHLDEETSRTDTGCDSPSTPQTNTSNNEVPQANHRSESFATRTGNGKPIIDRVLGRRESNKRPDQKTDHKSSMPLKSALRQPRLSGNFDVKKYAVSRSNSLPRDSKVAFNIGNEAIELRKPVKSVHYDDSVKSKEIAQDQPPTSSLSSTQMEQALHPGKRETPIGGHDDKYSENVKPPLPSYQSISVIRKPPYLPPPATVSGKQLAYGNDNTSDLRETIVNTRNELLARNKSDTFKPAEGYNSHRSDVLPVFEDPSKSLNAAPYPNGLNRLFSKPKLSSSSDPSSNFYKSQDAVQQPPQRQTALPFSHYANSSAQHSQKESQLSSAPHKPIICNLFFTTPTTAYRLYKAGQPTRQPPPLYNKTPPGYSNTTHSFHDAFAQRVTAKQSEKTTSGLHRSLSVHEPSSDHTTVVDSTSICSSSNLDSGYGGNFYDSNTNGSPSEKSWYQQSLQSAALKMNATQMLNNHRHRNGNHNNQNSFFDQNDSAVNPKMSSKVQYTARPNHELAASDTSRVVQSRVQPAYAKHPVNGATSNERPMSSGHQANYGLVYPAPKRTIYSNMISDV